MSKKRLVGGEFLLDLSMIALVMSDIPSQTAITNQEVLAQLTDLKTYVKSQKSIKPIWVKLKDNDSFIVTKGELQKVNNQPNFVIRISYNGKVLIINVEFTQVLNEDDVPMDDYYIDTNDATYNLSIGDTTFVIDNDDMKSIGDDILNQLKCGDIVLKKTGNQYHAYVVSYKEHNQGICLTYTDCSCIETLSYDYTSNHWVFNSKDVSFVNQLEQIKDSAGRNRFIEGDITIETIEGITQTYGKWSLSGTHLMIVLCLSCENASTITGKTANLNLPQWILDKITPLTSNVVNTQNFTFRATDNSTQTTWFGLFKPDDTHINISSGTLVLTADRNVRIEFDLLIDTDSGE